MSAQVSSSPSHKKETRPFAPWATEPDPKFGPFPAFRETDLCARRAQDRIAGCAKLGARRPYSQPLPAPSGISVPSETPLVAQAANPVRLTPMMSRFGPSPNRATEKEVSHAGK